jgi:integrase
MPTVKLRDGDITLYTRGDSANWYAGYRLADGGRLQESLKTRNKAEAKERAIARYDELKWRKKLGLTQDTVSFAQAADAWITHLEGEVAAGTRKIRTVLDYKPCADRYLKPFFGDKAIDSITAQDIAKYRVWRRDYWIKGPGSLLKQIEYERDGKTITRKLTKKNRKAPSPQTINGENVVLRGILDHAVTQGWLTLNQVPKIENAEQKASDSRERAYPVFTQEEYTQLLVHMKNWPLEKGIPEKEKWRREAIYHFILILFNTGLREHELYKKDERTGEIRGLRWCDVDFFVSDKGKWLAELHVRGKTGERKVIAQNAAARWLHTRRITSCKKAKPEDFVMAMPDGSLVASFDSGVRGVLTKAGLRKDPKSGKNRGIYSFRHSYATWRLQAGRSPIEIARNMGTSLAMIERHYYHYMPRMVADRLTSGKAVGEPGNAEAGEED